MEFRPCSFNLWNSSLILSIIGILALSFQSSEFWAYPFNHWNCGLILSIIGIPALSFQSLEFQPYSFRYWNYGPTFLTFEFWLYIGFLALFLVTLELWPIFINTGFPAPSFQTLEFLSFFYKHGNSDPIVLNTRILALLL